MKNIAANQRDLWHVRKEADKRRRFSRYSCRGYDAKVITSNRAPGPDHTLRKEDDPAHRCIQLFEESLRNEIPK